MNRPCCALLRLVPILFVAACGQSGPLYLPGNPSEIQAPSPGSKRCPARISS